MHMPSPRDAAIVALSASLLCLPAAAAANPTTYLKFDTFEVEDEVVSSFYKELTEAIEDHPEMTLVKGGKVTFSDLTDTIGCGTEEECLPELQDFVKARRVVYGSIQHTDNIYLFTIKVHDFETGKALHPTTETTIEGEQEDALKAIPTLIESALYGAVGELTISGPDGAEVLIDGKKVGEIPFESKTLPLGEHVVVLRESNGNEQEKTVFLQREKQAKLSFEDTGVVEPPPPKPLDLTVPAYVSFGVGALALGYGIFSGVSLLGLESEAAAFEGRTSVSRSELDDIQRIEQANDSAYTGMVVGASLGVVAIAAGAVMMLLPNSETPEPTALRFSILPTAESVHLGMGWSF